MKKSLIALTLALTLTGLVTGCSTKLQTAQTTKAAETTDAQTEAQTEAKESEAATEAKTEAAADTTTQAMASTASAEVVESDVKVSDVKVTTDNDGEENQHVNFIFTFEEEPGTVLATDFSVNLVGSDLEDERKSLVCEGSTVTLTVRTDAIKAGLFELDYSGRGAHGFLVHAIVSPGMKLEMVSQDGENATATARVSELFNIRGIGRVMLIENGETVMTQIAEPAPFTGIHGHNFLELDGKTIAEKMVFGLSESFPEGYEFTSDGDTVTVKKTEAEGTVLLELKVQEKLELEQK